MPGEGRYMAMYRRLAGMGYDELRVRTGQELAKRWDRSFGKYLIKMPWNHSEPGIEAPSHFFFSNEHVPEILSCLRERFSRTVESIIERAERICRHQFDLLGYESV